MAHAHSGPFGGQHFPPTAMQFRHSSLTVGMGWGVIGGCGTGVGGSDSGWHFPKQPPSLAASMYLRAAVSNAHHCRTKMRGRVRQRALLRRKVRSIRSLHSRHSVLGNWAVPRDAAPAVAVRAHRTARRQPAPERPA